MGSSVGLFQGEFILFYYDINLLKVDFQMINHTNSIYHTLQTVHAIILKRNKIKKIKEEDAIQIAPRDEEEDGFI